VVRDVYNDNGTHVSVHFTKENMCILVVYLAHSSHLYSTLAVAFHR
jgi:hypothetical protein